MIGLDEGVQGEGPPAPGRYLQVLQLRKDHLPLVGMQGEVDVHRVCLGVLHQYPGLELSGRRLRVGAAHQSLHHHDVILAGGSSRKAEEKQEGYQNREYRDPQDPYPCQAESAGSFRPFTHLRPLEKRFRSLSLHTLSSTRPDFVANKGDGTAIAPWPPSICKTPHLYKYCISNGVSPPHSA